MVVYPVDAGIANGGGKLIALHAQAELVALVALPGEGHGRYQPIPPIILVHPGRSRQQVLSAILPEVDPD